MKIVHNGLFLTRPHTGMGQYSTNLLAALAKAMPRDQHIILAPEAITEPPPDMTVRMLKPSWGSLQPGMALDRWESYDVPKAAAGLGADIYHAPYPTPPPQAKWRRYQTVMAVHDMIPWQFPQYRKGLRTKYKLRRLLSGIRTADRITTVSKTAAADITAVALVPSSRISVTYDGAGPDYRKRPSSTRIARAKRAAGLRRPYLFYLGGFDYRKNVRTLIRGFAESGLAKSHNLVLAGSVTSGATALHEDFNRLSELLEQAGIARQTKRPGFVAEADKPALMAGADLFVYPSFAEGFGLPVLEALGVGTRVATSDLPVFRELFGNLPAYFDPELPTDLAKTIRQAVGRPPAPANDRAALLKKYDWNETARRTARIFRQLSRK